MADKKEVPILSIQLASGSTAVVPRSVELGEREKTNYGEKWHKIVALLDHIQEQVDSSVESSSQEDASVAKGACELLQVSAIDDRSCLFHQEVDEILKKTEDERWDGPKLGLHLALLASAYGMDYQELTEQLTKRRLVSYGIELIPHGHFSFEGENVANVNLTYFTNTEIEISGDKSTIEMNPVYDGGIDDLAYPLHHAKLTFTKDSSINVAIATDFFRSHELNKEIWEHPEIINFLKGGFVRVMNRYASDRKGFWDERKGNGRIVDTTQLDDQLFDFMEKDYLKKKLDNVQYKLFQQKLKYVDSANVSAVVSLKAISEEILDNESYLRTGYYAEHVTKDLERIVDKTKTALERLGCKIEDGVFTNFFEIVDKAAKDRKFANKTNALWESIFTGGDKVLVDMMKHDVKNWAGLYLIDLHASTFQKALEAARGIVVLNGFTK